MILSPGASTTTNDNQLILINPYGTNSDEERRTRIKFQGRKNGETISTAAHTMAEIVTSHSGTSNDYKGMIKFNVNDGNG